MTERPSREFSLMQTAYIWAARSTCSRLHVGCVISRDGRILVQGYNGAPAGLEHCDHTCNCPEGYPKDEWRDGRMMEVHRYSDAGCPAINPCTRSVHAEQNAIAFAARWGVGLEGAELFCTNQPCLPCAHSIINAGIGKVWYVEPYRLPDGKAVLLEAGLEVFEYLDFSLPS